MKIIGISNNNTVFKGWRTYTKEDDIKKLSKYYEREKLIHKNDCGLPYTFDDVMEIYNWLDNNTPKHELYLDSKWAGYHYIVAKDLDTFNKKEYCLDINEIYSGAWTRYLIQGLKEAKKDLEIIYSHKPDKSSQTSP